MNSLNSRRQRIKVALAAVAVPFLLLTSTPAAQAISGDISNTTIVAAEGDDWKYVPKDSDTCEAPSVSTPKEVSTDSAPSDASAYGDFLNEGSETNKVAQEIFDYFTQTRGTSGAFASGALANIYHESGFIPDRIEGAGILRFGMDRKTAPSGGPGGGLAQFTPYSKYTESEFWQKDGLEGWAVKNQMDYLWSAEFANKAVMMYVASTNPGYGAASYGRPANFTTIEDFLSTDDPRKAADSFMVGYERPAKFDAGRLDLAAEINAVFNKDSIKADKDKLGQQFSSSSADSGVEDVSGTEASSNSSSSNGSSDNCDTSSDSSGKKSGGAADGTGTHNYNSSGWGQAWRANDLPEDLEQYALQPEEFGIENLDCTNWVQFTNTHDPGLNNQCVALTKAFAGSYWKKPDGTKLTIPLCNGIECAANFASANGGKYSDVPTKGAIASIDPVAPYGHTYIVAHVFENEDILILEQNTPFSGGGIGTVCDWNWRVQSKESYTKDNARFYNPADQGFEPVNGSKSE